MFSHYTADGVLKERLKEEIFSPLEGIISSISHRNDKIIKKKKKKKKKKKPKKKHDTRGN